MRYILVTGLALINLSIVCLPAMSQAETEKKQPAPAAAKKKAPAIKVSQKKPPKSRSFDEGSHMMDGRKVTGVGDK